MSLGSLDIRCLGGNVSMNVSSENAVSVADCCRRTQVHDVVSANGTVIDDNIPGPKGDCVPLDQASVVLFSFQGWLLPRLLD